MIDGSGTQVVSVYATGLHNRDNNVRDVAFSCVFPHDYSCICLVDT